MRWLVLALASAAGACSGASRRPAAARGQADSGFAAMQGRGEMVMGVNQYTSAHVFEDLPDGGRIVLDRDTSSDTAGVARIRQHMRDITASFQAGDFAKPFQVHAEAVPGTAVMAARRRALTHQEPDRPRGAEGRVHTRDAAPRGAGPEFLALPTG